MTLPTPGLIGAGAGLLFALAVYVAMSIAWRRHSNDTTVPVDARERFAALWPVVRLVLIADFFFMAVAGYFAGETLGL
jgi:hypothetical protein